MAESLEVSEAIEPVPGPSDSSKTTLVDDRDRKGSTVSAKGMDENRRGSRATIGPSGGKKEGGKGLTEGDAEMEALPDNNLALVMPAIGLVLFLAALDQTIVATALPTIAEELNASPSEYQWVGTAYTLAMTMQGPINGRVSDIVGRKPMLYAAILIFLVFSALCGAAKSMSWLITARAFQGLGGGAIIGLTAIITSDIVPLDKRGAYQGYIGGTWGIAAVLGPIIGGALTTKASWRWCFYINLPTCALAFALIFFTLKLNPTKKYTFAKLRQTFDFLGLFLIMAAGALLIVGFASAADNGFDQPAAYGVIIAGAVALAAAVVNCLITKRNAIIPARMFKIRTTLFFLIASLVHAIAFIPSNYLLPQMFQGVQGADALTSGLMLIPYAFCVAWSTVLAGQINSRLRIVRPVPWTGYVLGAIGFGLFYRFFTYPISLGIQEGLSVIAGIGVGLSLSAPLLVIQAAMPLKEMAAATSAWTLMRSLGGSIGLAIFTAVLNTGLRSRFALIPGYGTQFVVPESTSGYAQLHDLPDGPTKNAVLSAFADSLGTCWIIDCGMLLACLAITIWTKAYSLKRKGGGEAKAERETASGPAGSSDPDVEKGPNAEVDGGETRASPPEEGVLRGCNVAPSERMGAGRNERAGWEGADGKVRTVE